MSYEKYCVLPIQTYQKFLECTKKGATSTSAAERLEGQGAMADLPQDPPKYLYEDNVAAVGLESNVDESFGREEKQAKQEIDPLLPATLFPIPGASVKSAAKSKKKEDSTEDSPKIEAHVAKKEMSLRPYYIGPDRFNIGDSD